MKTCKILQVIGGLNRGGAETMLMNLYRKMNREQYEFVFLTYTKGKKEQDYEREIRENGDVIVKLDSQHLNNPFLLYKDLVAVMKDDQYDCIHCHTLFNSGIVMVAAKHCKIPIRITHSHSCGNMKKNSLINTLYFSASRHFINKYSTAKIACSLEAGEYLFGTKPFTGSVIKNGVDLDKFNPNTPPKYSLHPELKNKEKLKIAAIGSFYTVKNHKFMVELARKMKEETIDFCMFFVGRGPLEDEIKEQIKEYGLTNHVFCLGVLNNVQELLPAIDAVIMPSLYEGIPVSLIEAQASGTPAVISTNISRDVDLGLGLIHFLDINENYREWIDQLLYYKFREKVNSSSIEESFKKNSYSIDENLKILTEIYDGKN